jgi:dTDP-4-amino-4,6-dideoxygalactose transaminase
VNGNKRRIYLSPPHMSGEEQRFVAETFETNWIAPLGPQVDAFETEFCEKVGISHAVALNSGTAAMHLALRALGVGPGDEVIAPSLTFIGGVSPVLFQGAKLAFIDSDTVSWNMDPNLLQEEMDHRSKTNRMPKVVIVADIYGQCADYDAIHKICASYGVPVLADSAEALGATYHGRCAGAGAKAAIYSFNGNKIITTSGGGMLAAEDETLIEQARFWSQQARDPAPHYEHTQVGYNYRLSNVLAAIGRGQLRVLDERVQKKRWIFDYYQKALSGLPGIEFMPEIRSGKSTRWLTVVLITPEKFGADREAVRLALEKDNIEARPVWKPMHMQPVFKGIPMRGGKVCEDLFRRGLCLPSGTAMTTADLDRIIEIIKKAAR